MSILKQDIQIFLAGRSIELTEEPLQEILYEAIEMEQPMDFSNLGYELIRLRREQDGEVQASSLKAYNILKVDQRALRRSIVSIGAQGALLASVNGLLALAASLLLIALDFEELLVHEFEEGQAKVLLALYFTEPPLTREKIQAVYRRFHKEEIAVADLDRRLDFLTSLRTVKKTAEDSYTLMETITFKRHG